MSDGAIRALKRLARYIDAVMNASELYEGTIAYYDDNISGIVIEYPSDMFALPRYLKVSDAHDARDIAQLIDCCVNRNDAKVIDIVGI